jgi:hypothetical protein
LVVFEDVLLTFDLASGKKFKAPMQWMWIRQATRRSSVLISNSGTYRKYSE